MKENTWMTIVAVLVIALLVFTFIAFKDKMGFTSSPEKQEPIEDLKVLSSGDSKLDALTMETIDDEPSDAPTVSNQDIISSIA